MRFLKCEQFGLLFFGAAGGDAHNVAGLRNFGGEVKEDERLPVLRGRACCREGCVVYGER